MGFARRPLGTYKGNKIVVLDTQGSDETAHKSAISFPFIEGPQDFAIPLQNLKGHVHGELGTGVITKVTVLSFLLEDIPLRNQDDPQRLPLFGRPGQGSCKKDSPEGQAEGEKPYST